MAIIDENQALESEFNMRSDLDILLMLTGKKLSVKEKKYLIEHCQNRIEKMDVEIFLQTIRQIDQAFCKACNQYLSSKIPSLTVAQTEELLYENKNYHEMSEIAIFLVQQDWFQSKKEDKYKSFFIAFELEKMLDMESISEEKIVTMGADIINLLTSTNGSSMVFDMVIKNYLSLLGKQNPQYFESFKIQGYEVINQQIAYNKELTPNMVIFDCGVTKKESNSNVDYFEFYDKGDKQTEEAFAYAHAGRVCFNTTAIKDFYQQYENKKIATQILFYVIGHETDHVYCERYKSNMNNDSMEELRVFNSRISSALQEATSRKFYKDYHNCFSHEFLANIKGIETLYYKQKLLPSITKADKEEINRLLARILFSSYCRVVDDSTRYGYVGPVEFSREEFKELKDNLPGYACHCLLNNQKELPSELVRVEENLTEIEKFSLGYYNQYIGTLKLIANGKISSVNLFEDLPTLYDQYEKLNGETFPPYLTNEDSNIKKK